LIFQILLGILIIIIVVIISNSYIKEYENFDARIKDISFEKCSNTCTKVYSCIGFSYDKKNKNCYLANNPIVGTPMDSIYKDEYEPGFIFCNKPDPIRTDIDSQFKDALAKNTIYACKEGEDGDAGYKSMVDEKVTDLVLKDSKISIKPYKLKQIIWNDYKKDLDPDIITKDNYLNKIVFYDYDPDHEYNGKYMFEHKCVSNVPLFDCLKKCTIEEDCVGVEYNPLLLTKQKNGLFKKDKNICCLKSSEDEKIDRSEKHINGAYYKKSLEDDAYKTDIYIRNYQN